LKRITLVALIIFLFNCQLVLGQGGTNWAWWYANVGQSPTTAHDNWVDYIKFTPGMMGPNALPVPDVKKGKVSNDFSLELGAQAHFGNGDKTQNIWTNLNVNLAKDRVSLIIYAVPEEHFNISDKTRDARQLSGEYYDAKGYAKGDVYFGMEIQILKNRPKGPDLMLRLMTKSATGSDRGAARFTDSPGYYFDLSAGKDFSLGNGKIILRPYAMLGFYSWQTYDEPNPQNDAPLYGGGLDLNLSKNVISTSLGGYSGWKGFGDKPLVYRLEYLRKGKKFDFLAQYQIGNNDFDYNSFKLSVVFHTVILKKSKQGNQ